MKRVGIDLVGRNVLQPQHRQVQSSHESTDNEKELLIAEDERERRTKTRKLGLGWIPLVCYHNRRSLVAVLAALALAIATICTGMTIHEKMDPVRVIRPFASSPGRTVFGQIDDLSVGKSCLRTNGRWRCQQCEDGKCHALKASGKCPEFPMQEWDSPLPRSQSSFDSFAHSYGLSRMLTRFGYKKAWKTYYEQAVCSLSREECFDLSRCSLPLKVYLNSSAPQELLEFALTTRPDILQRVDTPDEACLVLLIWEDRLFDAWPEVASSHSWNHGKNHFVWLSSCGSPRCDQPFLDVNFELAAIAYFAFPYTHLRQGFDIPTPLAHETERKMPFSAVDPTKDRKILISFKGKLQNTLQPYYQHRWLAREFWEDADDVLIDAQCDRRTLGLLRKKRQIVLDPYKLPRDQYFDILFNSTFGFAPGGSGVSSFRFGEILATGGIPVLTSEALPPFYPEIDWSECIFRVSEARIIDLPRLLRQISPDEVRKRRLACGKLYMNTMGEKEEGSGWRADPRRVFTTAMEVWAARIKSALAERQILVTLNQNKTARR